MITPKIAAILGIPKKAQERFSAANLSMGAAAEGEVLVYGAIVNAEEQTFFAEFLGDTTRVSDKSFREELNAIDGDVTIRINSPGGDVWAASGMQAALIERRNKGDKVYAIVDGVAASAATLLPLVADEVKIAPMGQMMIHEAHGFLGGTAGDFAHMAAFLKSTTEATAKMYAERMGISRTAVMALLENETWYTAEQAVENKLADSIVAVKAGKSSKEAAAEMFARRSTHLALCGAQ